MNYTRYSDFFKTVAIIFCILSIVGGIVIGYVYKIPDNYSYIYDEFNTALMIYTWIGGLLTSTILYAIYAHLKHQEEQIDAIYTIKLMLGRQNTAEKTPQNAS